MTEPTIREDLCTEEKTGLHKYFIVVAEHPVMDYLRDPVPDCVLEFVRKKYNTKGIDVIPVIVPVGESDNVIDYSTKNERVTKYRAYYRGLLP